MNKDAKDLPFTTPDLPDLAPSNHTLALPLNLIQPQPDLWKLLLCLPVRRRLRGMKTLGIRQEVAK